MDDAATGLVDLVPADTPRADHEFVDSGVRFKGQPDEGEASDSCVSQSQSRWGMRVCGLPRSAHPRPEPAERELENAASPVEHLETLIVGEDGVMQFVAAGDKCQCACADCKQRGWHRSHEKHVRAPLAEPTAGDPLGEIREALESARAGVWDSHYGKGIAVEYARSVDRKVRAALVILARYGLKEQP